MATEEFSVQNVKCGGCVSTIENGLKDLAGVTGVSATVEGGKVIVTGDNLSREAIAAKLAELGYPEV